VAQRGGGLAERSGGERLHDRDELLVLGVFAGSQAAQDRLGGGPSPRSAASQAR
jgi:hypothetical protein